MTLTRIGLLRFFRQLEESADRSVVLSHGGSLFDAAVATGLVTRDE